MKSDRYIDNSLKSGRYKRGDCLRGLTEIKGVCVGGGGGGGGEDLTDIKGKS